MRIRGLLTLERRFLRADLIEVFKILGGFENLDPDRFFQVIGDGAGLKLFKKRYRLDVRKFKFASMVCQEWNRLGDGIVRFRNVELKYFIFQFEHRYHTLPLATIRTTSRQSIRGWLSSM